MMIGTSKKYFKEIFENLLTAKGFSVIIMVETENIFKRSKKK